MNKSFRIRCLELAVAILVVALFPYALFGRHPKTAKWVALANGVTLRLSLIFLTPLFLLPNPFLALFATSTRWHQKTASGRK